MNHTFVAAPWNKSVCMNCALSEQVHADDYPCEACDNKSGVINVGKLLLCQSCASKENLPTSKPVVTNQLSLEQIINQVDRIVETNQITNQSGDSVKSILDEAIKGDIKQYKDFFNAKMPSILELEEVIAQDSDIINKREALAIALRKRVSYLAMVLFQTRSSQIQIGAEIKTIQHYMSEMIPKLRADIRKEFAANTPNYTPQTVQIGEKPKARAKSKSPEERLAESYAKSMKISYEDALKKIRNKLRDDCTCSVTPGMCKVHNNISQSK
jgi:hypothetical protein